MNEPQQQPSSEAALRRQLDEARGDAARLAEALKNTWTEWNHLADVNRCLCDPEDTKAAPCDCAGDGREEDGSPTDSGCLHCSARWEADQIARALTETPAAPAPNPPAPPLPQGAETGLEPGQRCTLWRHSTDSAHWYEASIAETWEARRDKHHRCPYIEPSAPQAPATFEQLVTAAGPLPTTGLASAEPAPGADPNCIECEGSGEESDCDYCYSTKPCRCLKRSREGMK